MTSIDEEMLIAAWHSLTPMYAVARAFSLKEEQVRNAWRQLQLENKLPAGRRSFVKPGNKRLKRELAPRPMTMSPNVNSGVQDHIDGRPSLQFHDPLLDRLQEVHHTPRYDIAPELRRKSL